VGLFGPGEEEGLTAKVGADMAVEKGAVASAPEPVARGGVVETGNNIPELANTFGAWFDQTRVAADLVEPALDHRIIAGDHEGIVQP